MGIEGPAQPRVRRRTVAAATAAACLLVIFLAGLTFANSIGASRVAGNAASLHWANSAAGTSALTRAALAQAITFADMAGHDMATQADLDFAMEQVEVSISELETLEETAGGSSSVGLLTHFLGGVERTRHALAQADTTTAMGEMETLEEIYEELVASLQLEQDQIQETIDANTEAAARVNGYVMFVLVLAIPASAVIVYWRIARRQYQELQTRTDLELETERAVSRAKDSFIAGLSHELRTPLTSIYGFAEILTDGGGDDADQTREVARIIANEAAEMSRMVDDLLAASRLESTGVEVEIAPTKVESVVASAVAPFERAGVSVDWSPTPAMVETDGARLRHVLVNLISNAVRHGGPKTGIEVSAADDTVDIEVWDNGPGVAEDRVPNLFDRFAHEGSAPLLTGSVGLGLAVAARLTTKLGGHLAYQRFGGRTYFVVSLPVYLVDDEEESVTDVIRALSS
jgi:signal transduction histidine kinase